MSRRNKNKAKNIGTVDSSQAVVKTITTSRGRVKSLRDPVESYGRRQTFTPSEYSLSEISLIEDGESYVRQAFQKKTALMFKEGEVFTGKNQETINYIKTRLRQMEYVTGSSWRTLLGQTGKDLIAKSNFFWVKVRNDKASGGKSSKEGSVPVAGYFPLPAETVKVKKNKNGKIIKYRQEMPGGRWKEFFPKDVIHFKCNVKPGFTFGTPQIIPVIPDIQALRRLEENVEILFYQTLFPIFQYKVGTESKPAGTVTLPDGSVVDEIGYVRDQIANMPTEGGVVTPERHDLSYIGAEGQIPNYQNILAYFKGRVLSGLGISSIDIGDGDSSNRATADSLSKALIDSVKHYQDVFEQVINSHVIPELLMEGGFSFDPLAEENFVEMKFIEIDIEEQMKKNVNAQLLFSGDIWDIDEARAVTGKQPLEKSQEDKMFTERQTVKIAGIEAEHAESLAKIGAAQTAAASSKATAKTAAKKKAATKTAINKSAPTNQHGTKTGPQKSKLDGLVKNEGRLLITLADALGKDTPDYQSCVEAAILRIKKKTSHTPEGSAEFADKNVEKLLKSL